MDGVGRRYGAAESRPDRHRARSCFTVGPTCRTFRRPGRNGCNNEAELRALLSALDAAAAAGARTLTLHSDSRFAVDCLNGLDSTDVPRLVELLAAAHTAMGCFDQVRLVWLPRHRNAEADRLARAALGLAPKPAPAKRKRRR